MTIVATETSRPGTVARSRPRRRNIVRFFAFDGAMRMVIEADGEDEARYLCREMRWDFICVCDR